MKAPGKVYLLRAVHGALALYFSVCLAYLYYAFIASRHNILLLIAVISLGIEGFAVFVVSKGDCPLIHVQRKLGDDKPFFQLFLPAKIAKKAIPAFAVLTLVAVALLLIQVASHWQF